MTNGAIVKHNMRLRNRQIPQAGPHQRESRPVPKGAGSPIVSEGGNVSQSTAQASTVADNKNYSPTSHIASSPPLSHSPPSSMSLFESPHSSPQSYQLYSSTSSSSYSHSNNTSPMSKNVAQEARATTPLPIIDNTNPTQSSELQLSNSVVQTHITNTHTDTPARSVLKEMLPPTTLAGKSRQRMKWTDEINRELLRCYYLVTFCETDLTAYRPLLHRKFLEAFPELSHISEQRLADQIRVIHRNNRIPPHERDRIKQAITLTNTHNIDTEYLNNPNFNTDSIESNTCTNNTLPAPTDTTTMLLIQDSITSTQQVNDTPILTSHNLDTTEHFQSETATSKKYV